MDRDWKARIRKQIETLTPEQTKIASELISLLKAGRRIISPAPDQDDFEEAEG